MALSAEEFLRRFVQHVLPKGFVKMRHYGLLANCCRQDRLDACRRLLLVTTAIAQLARNSADSVVVEPALKPCCPSCGGTRFVRLELPQTAAVPTAADTS